MRKRQWVILFWVIGGLCLVGACQGKVEEREKFYPFFDQDRQLTSKEVDSIVRSTRDLPVREKCSLLLDMERSFLLGSPLSREKLLKDILACAPDDMRRRVKLQLFGVYALSYYRTTETYSARDSGALLLLELEREKHLTMEERSRFLYDKSSFFEDFDLEEALSIALQGLTLQRERGSKEGEQTFLLHLVFMHVRSQNYAASVYYCQSLLSDVSRLPDSYEFHVYNTLALAYKELGRYDEATEAALKARAVRKKLSLRGSGVVWLIDICIKKGDGEGARYWLKEENSPKSRIFYQKLAQSYDCEGKVDSAAHIRERFVREFKMKEKDRELATSNMPPLVPDFLAYANWLWDKKRCAEALDLLSRVIKIPESNSSLWFWGDKHLALLEKYYTYCVAMNRPEEAIAGLIQLNDFRKRLSEYREVSLKKDVAARAFSKELVSQINRQKQAVRNRERWVWTSSMVAVMVAVFAVGAWVMYRRKKRMLDALYLKQKALERVFSVRTTEQETCDQDERSREERLFYKMDALLKKDQLFVNPNLTLDDVALLVGTNRSYTSAAVNVCTGMNFSQWIQKLRVEYFISQLKGNEDRVEEFSLKSGFSSSSSFYRSFKNHTGLTPKQYIVREKKGL